METKKLQNVKKGFTIVELLTVMSIIVILISMLVPALAMAKRYAMKVQQKNQFKHIDAGLQLYESDFRSLPSSSQFDPAGTVYNGAMKLAEAMVGRDFLGFNPDSQFYANGTSDGAAKTVANDLYPPPAATAAYTYNLGARKGPYMALENAKAFQYVNIYGNQLTIDPNAVLLTDVYLKLQLKPQAGQSLKGRCGFPILYYKADPSGMSTPADLTETSENTSSTIKDGPAALSNTDRFFKWEDNDDVVRSSRPGETEQDHPMQFGAPAVGGDPTGANMWGNPARKTTPYYFYNQIWNRSLVGNRMPYNKDSYILVSAGFDGLYGTKDDVFNFEP